MRFTNLFPGDYVPSTYTIDYERLYNEGYRGIIYDIDNTLVCHNAPANEQAIALFQRLGELGFETCLLSNNKEPRVASFNEPIGTHYVFLAGKPGRGGYLEAMRQMGTTPETTIFIGDQIFTDIWGANRTGIRSILVRRIYYKEEPQIVLKRILEFFILIAYRIYKRGKTNDNT